MSWSSLLEAESSLLARRRAQRGDPTLGDDADAALLVALASLPGDAHAAARLTGQRIGALVYARRFFEDSLPGAVAVLSAGLAASGAGSMLLHHWFHRSARLRYDPSPVLVEADRAVVSAFAQGAVEGFFGSAFNCEARAAVEDDIIHLELGEGRDVNRKEAAA